MKGKEVAVESLPAKLRLVEKPREGSPAAVTISSSRSLFNMEDINEKEE